MTSTKHLYLLGLASITLSVLLHWRVFSLDLQSNHVWRQSQTQTVINNFYEEDFCILNPRINCRGDTDGIMRMEFPLMQWLFAASYKLFGPSVKLSRILSFGLGLLTALGLLQLCNQFYKNKQIGLLSFHALLFAPSFYYYTIGPLPDNFALCVGTWGLYAATRWTRVASPLAFLSCLILLATAALVKLPFILFYAVPGMHALSQFRANFKQSVFYIVSMSISALPVLAWYLWVIPSWQGNGIITGIVSNESNWGNNLYWLFGNLISTLPELLIGYATFPLFLLGTYMYFRKPNSAHEQLRIPYLALTIVLCLYVIFEINMITTIHDYYLFPFYPILILAVATGADYLLNKKQKWATALVLTCLVLLPVTTKLRMQIRWRSDRLGFNPALLEHREQLQALSDPEALCIVGNDISRHIFLYYLNRKGWAFYQDQLTEAEIEIMVNSGAAYLYSDSRMVDTNTAIQPYLNSLLLEAGTIRVYRLRKP